MFLTNQKYGMHCGKQSGFVLVLALVLLAVMTLIGVSSMNSANMELKATANAQQHHYAFTMGQSVLEYIVSTTAVTTVGQPFDFQTSDATPQLASISMDSVAITGDATFSGCSVGVGTSLEEGKGFSYNFFNVVGNGVNKTGTATSIQSQGIRFPAAACN